MGKKKSCNKKQYVHDEKNKGDSEEDGLSFAEKLLASMEINSKTEACEEPNNRESFNSHGKALCHLHSFQQNLKSVFKPDSSKPSRTTDAADSIASDLNFHKKSTSDSKGLDIESSDTLEKERDNILQMKKRNRRKEKILKREREHAKLIQEVQAEAKSIPDKRSIELKGMSMMITQAGLVEFEVQPDGHCLFHSICDQLEQRNGIKLGVQDLRSALANFIRRNPDDFVPYLVEDETGDVKDVSTYTNDLENTPLWGGELEIMAASRLYEVPIKIYFASRPPLGINEERFADRDPLRLAYYQAKFGLGAHYNSLRNKPLHDEEL